MLTLIKDGKKQGVQAVIERGLRLIFLAGCIGLAGCVRPVGERVTPTIDAVASPVVIDGGIQTFGEPAITLVPLTPNLPTREAVQVVPPIGDAGGDPILPTTTPILPTLPPGEVGVTQITPIRPTTTPPPTAIDASQPTAIVITPGLSLGFLTPDTPLPRPTATVTPEGFVAPAGGADLAGGLSADGCVYAIESGDTLSAIAIGAGTTVAEILAANPDLSNERAVLQIGQLLQLPACIVGLATRTPVPTTTAPDAPTALPDGEPTSAATALPEGAQIHVVAPGDTIYAIAIRYGVTQRAIVDANTLRDPNRLSIGQRLIIPPRP